MDSQSASRPPKRFTVLELIEADCGIGESELFLQLPFLKVDDVGVLQLEAVSLCEFVHPA